MESLSEYSPTSDNTKCEKEFKFSVDNYHTTSMNIISQSRKFKLTPLSPTKNTGAQILWSAYYSLIRQHSAALCMWNHGLNKVFFRLICGIIKSKVHKSLFSFLEAIVVIIALLNSVSKLYEQQKWPKCFSMLPWLPKFSSDGLAYPYLIISIIT